MSREKMPLKTFWESVEQRLTACSADELRAIVRAMAQEALPLERQAFLDKLKPKKETAAAVQKALRQDKLLAEIDDCIRELKAAMEGADYEEDDYGWRDDYDDEDSLGPYEKFVDSLTGLFDRTQAAFDYGNFSLARTAYQKLFEKALQLEDDYGRGVRAEDLTEVDVDESCARYLRAVYEIESPAARPAKLFAQMQKAQAWLMQERPMLETLIQISPAPLPQQDQFFQGWIAFLRKQKGKEADAWLREAIRLAQGVEGLAELARAEGKKRPRVYLDWFTALEAEDKPREVLAAAQAALKTLPDKLPIRAAIADHLCTAAAKLNETETLRAGRWEAFRIAPTLSRLLDLWEAAPEGKEQTALMRQAADHIQDYLAHPPRESDIMASTWNEDDNEDNLESPVWIEKSVLAHAYLLAEEVDAVYQLAASENVLGWSSDDNPQGLVVPFFLAQLAEKAPNAFPPNLKQLWQQGLQTSIGFEWAEAESGLQKRLERIYAELLSRLSLSKEQQKTLLAWCLNVAKQRTEAIVSDKHRGSYDKAARLIGACAEVLRLRGEPAAADTLLEKIRERFPRHRAFLAELDTATERVKRNRR
jgi:hypothetical protein